MISYGSIMIMSHSIVMITCIFVIWDMASSTVSSAFGNRWPFLVLLNIGPVMVSYSSIMVMSHSIVMITCIFVIRDVTSSSVGGAFGYWWPLYIRPVLRTYGSIMVMSHSIVMIASIFIIWDVAGSAVSATFGNGWPRFNDISGFACWNLESADVSMMSIKLDWGGCINKSDKNG